MPSYYENLVKKIGEEAAREKMRETRSHRKINKGGGFNDPKIVKKAIKTRTVNKKLRRKK